MNSASNYLANGLATDDEYMVKVIQANNIYRIFGKSVYPWEIDQLPDDWLDAIMEFAVNLPEKRRQKTNG